MDRNEFLSSFENVCELFEQVGSVSSRLAKESLLANYPDREFLKDILLYCYNPYYVYGIDTETAYTTHAHSGIREFENIFELLDYLKENNSGKHSDKNIYSNFINKLDNDYSIVWAIKIVLKDLKIGVNISTINKVFHKLIPEFKVGLCKTYEDASSLRYENYIVQPKLDGVRIIVICTGGSAELFTRNGMKVEGYDDIVKDLSHDCWKDYVLDGEIMTDNFDGTMEGLFALKKDKKAVYNIFDIMTVKEFNEQKCPKEYYERFGLCVTKSGKCASEIIQVVTGKTYDKEVLQKDISILDIQARESGYEGLVIKGISSLYEFKRSYAWTKYKSWQSEDFEVIGMEEGTGKYEGMLGALVVNASGVEVKVGSGFTDIQREHLWITEECRGWIAEVKFQEKTKDGSLRFPTFIKFRNDGV